MTDPSHLNSLLKQSPLQVDNIFSSSLYIGCGLCQSIAAGSEHIESSRIGGFVSTCKFNQ